MMPRSVVHIWFFKAMPSRLEAPFLEMKTSNPREDHLFPGLRRRQSGAAGDRAQGTAAPHRGTNIARAREATAETGSGPRSGAEAVKELLEKLDLVELSKTTRRSSSRLSEKAKPDRSRSARPRQNAWRSIASQPRQRLSAAPANKAEWMSVEGASRSFIPPDLRPLVLLDSGNFATSDSRTICSRGSSAAAAASRSSSISTRWKSSSATRSGCSSSRSTPSSTTTAAQAANRLGSSNRPLEVADRHDQGQAGPLPREPARQDASTYSARSVIVVGPELRLHQCGLPKKIPPLGIVPAVHRSPARRIFAMPTRSSRPRRCSNARPTKV